MKTLYSLKNVFVYESLLQQIIIRYRNTDSIRDYCELHTCYFLWAAQNRSDANIPRGKIPVKKTKV